MIKKLIENGLSVVPITPGAKYPNVKWDIFQSRLATPEEYQAWKPPIGIVGGKVSGGLVCIDFDDRGSRFEDWMGLVLQFNAKLALALVIQRTPSGGYHAIYRCQDVTIGNTKLAGLSRPNQEGKIDLIETRSEGGQFLVAPSPGYDFIQNDLSMIPTIKKESHETLIDLAKSFNQKIAEIKQPENNNYSISPFDDFDSKNTPIDLLVSHGWTVEISRGDVVYLKRPGKKERGVSASWNHVPGRFYVWSTNTEFENNHIYKPSAVYAVLEQRGDFKAAARALLDRGFGTPKQLTKTQAKPSEILQVFRANDFKKDIWDIYKNGMPVGYDPGIPGLGNYYRVARGQLTVITGIPSHGKSEIFDAMMIGMAKKINWKFIVFSPENYPLSFHFKKLAEKYLNKSFAIITEEELTKVTGFIHDHFFFIPATENNISVDNILTTTEHILKTENIDGLLIDPWNEIEADLEENISETIYIGRALSVIRKFARRHNLATWIIAHPTKLRKEKQPDGSIGYSIPDLYSISGSANWYNKSDNGLVVWRDFEKKITKIVIQKIKFKFYGQIGEVVLRYVPESGNYEEAIEPIPENLFYNKE